MCPPSGRIRADSITGGGAAGADRLERAPVPGEELLSHHLAPVEPARLELGAGAAGHGEIGVVGIEHRAVLAPEDDADHVRLDDPAQTGLAVAHRALGHPAFGDVGADADQALRRAVGGERELAPDLEPALGAVVEDGARGRPRVTIPPGRLASASASSKIGRSSGCRTVSRNSWRVSGPADGERPKIS
jgi:hypothetical protein